MYIGDYLGRRQVYSPDKLAIIDAGKDPALRLTYRQLNERANRLANWLKSAGVAKGDRVAILARDGVEHLDCFFACGKLGAIHTAFNWRLHWREHRRHHRQHRAQGADLLGRFQRHGRRDRSADA